MSSTITFPPYSAGSVADELDTINTTLSMATLQGNTFNGANQLVQLDGTGKLPAVDGSQLTNLSSSPVSASSVSYDNTITGVAAANVQDAIDEIVGDIESALIAINGV